MRVVTWNVNELRAAIRKGFDEWFEQINADVWLLQETRVLEEQFPKGWNWPSTHEAELHPAQKKGYSGVATLGREMEVVGRGMQSEVYPEDTEGRILITKHGELTCINTYLPNGSAKSERQEFKERWMDDWRTWLSQFLDSKEPVIVAGDLNIAHTEDDIWNPGGNKKTSGFLPQEREWFSKLLSDGWVDSFRQKVGEGIKIYSWWSNRGNARELDRGWRIDYLLCNPAAANRVKSVQINREAGLQVSDHAPVILDLDF